MCILLYTYLRVEGRGNERGLEPPSSWDWKILGFVAFFRSVLVNRGVGDSFQFEMDNLGSCSFLLM
jgi:hypothetical protein